MKLRSAVLLTLGAGAGLAGGLALLNRALLLDDLPPMLPGATHDWSWRGWRVRYTTLGDGPPLLLVHGVHAAGSSFEMDRIFEPLSQSHTVYAVDLLGFGKSERPATAYSGALYADLVTDFLADVVRQPAVVVGSSLGAAYAVSAAIWGPTPVRALVLISPTGHNDVGLAGLVFGAMIRLPLIGTAAFNSLVSRSSIHRYLRQVYADVALVDDSLVEQHWAVAHQPGARYAPAALIAGQLARAFEASSKPSRAPILVVRGDQAGPGAEREDATLAKLGTRCDSRTIRGTGLLPHQEAPDRVVELIETWLASSVDAR